MEHFRAVAFVEEQHGIRRRAVASGPPRLLEVRLNGVGQVHVCHEAHVGLVDAHAESVGGHHDAHAPRHPVFLADFLVEGRETGVVEMRVNSFLIEHGRQFPRAFAAAGVDHCTAGHAAQDVQHFVYLVVRAAHHVAQIFPREAHAVDALAAEGEALHHVVHYLNGRRGGEGEDRTGQYFTQFGNAQIVGAEVVAPLRDAVRLVHGNKRNGNARYFLQKEFGGQPLGRYI